MTKNEKKIKKTVGVLGCFGTIGYCVTEKLLRNGLQVIGAQRRPSTLFQEMDNFQFFQVDICNADELEQFCRQCDLVINCISPAYLYGSIIAKAAASVGAIYLDGVGVVLEDKTIPENGTYIISSGYVPGLSEFLPKAIIKKEFDSAERVVVYQGGTELCSEAAFADIVLSGENSGYSESSYHNGTIRPFHVNMRNKYEFPDFPNKVMLKSFLGYEMLSLAKHMNLCDLYWLNAYQDMSNINLLLRAVRCSAGCNEKEEAAEKIKNCMREYIMTMPKKETYALLGMEIIGNKSGAEKIIQSCLYLKNSSRICGYTLAETAICALRNPVASGIHFAYEIIDTDYLSSLKTELQSGEYLYIREIPREEAILLKEPFISK